MLKELLGITFGATLLAAAGCSGGYICIPKTNSDLASLDSACIDVRVSQTDLEDLDGLETFEGNSTTLFVTENQQLGDVSAVPHGFHIRDFARNPLLVNVDMIAVSGQVSFYSNSALRTVSYSIGEPPPPPSDGDIAQAPENTLLLSGEPSLEQISLSCSGPTCKLDELEISSVGGTFDQMEFSIDEGLTIRRLVIGSLSQLTTLAPFYELPVQDSVRVSDLPALEDGSLEQFLENLAATGFNGTVEVCDDGLGNGCTAL